ncbi:MAG TPA: hypothetical protein VF890_05605 [Gemmatimonadales bacterium]
MTTAAAIAVAMLAAACGGGTGPADRGVPLSALLVLPRLDTDSAPPSAVGFLYHNTLLNTFSIRHSDASNTLFASYSFASHSIVSVNNIILADTSTVIVTVTLTSDIYGFTVSPAGMIFNSAGEPVVTVAYGKYGDFSVYNQSSKYTSAVAYEQALGLWRELSPDHWVLGRNSGHAGADTVASALESPGRYVIAAPK